MNKSLSIFETEEKIIEHAQAILKNDQFQNDFLLPEYSALYASYKRMFNQLRRLIKLSDSQQLRLNELNHKLDVANRFIRKAFGRYLSDEIVQMLLETPEGLKLGGDKRQVTILITDLRGFTAISERLSAEDVVKIINIYLEVMTDIIFKYQGTIDEFIGDAILVIFGAPVLRDDDAKRAIACALEMQLAMEEVNARNRNAGFPEIVMGIGINTGEVVVGNIGSSKRTQYGVIGRTVNLTSRIESYTVGGQILISKNTLDACGDILRIDEQLEVKPKGIKESLTIYDIGGIGGEFNIFLPDKEHLELIEFHPPISVKYAILEGKQANEQLFDGSIIKLKNSIAVIQSQRKCRNLTNLKFSLFDGSINPITTDLYAKVTRQISENPTIFRVHFTFIPPEAEVFFKKMHGLQIEQKCPCHES